ncbi:cyclic dehypoxanthinyl futalosine synthase [Hippea maritima]|uniref:Cyclic dehypoxanthine futalosine synthase n=1 Tax=Hippea maritima (strain ATCC 700847 / DSM 10411 / MH2) TaxID=760142 RepID=F2LVL2_HIPMA|nr:cyclic dehypoxanthinyl futalosine synthase [Hippea maritima]AEA33796.1 menaquinone biosynthesis protein [Hippea maritima DSM 10411]
MEKIYEKIRNFERINKEEGVRLLKEGDFLILGELASTIRFKKHPENIVTFILDTNINYTNICYVGCSFCAFYRKKTDPDAYTLSIDDLIKKIEEAESKGIETALIQGGLNPELPYSYYIEMVKELSKSRVHVHAFSPPEIDLMCKISRKSVDEVFEDLKNAGLTTMPGGGAEILTERVRNRISPKKINTNRWLEIMETAHRHGIKTTATMMFGHIETEEDIIEHLDRIRSVQDKTSGFSAFIAWDFKKENNELGKIINRTVSGIDYLKIVAISRIYLDNFNNIQASWASQGKDVGEVALHFGANDMGSMLVEENVMRQAGFRALASVEEIADIIKKAGFKPALRSTDYRIVKYL